MHKWGRTIPLDAKAIEDEVHRSDLYVEVPPFALREPHALLLYFTRMPDAYRQEVERNRTTKENTSPFGKRLSLLIRLLSLSLRLFMIADDLLSQRSLYL